jgi:predicted ATPase
LERRHALYYLALAETAEPEMLGPRQRAWLRCLEKEHDNLQRAMDWSVDLEELETGLRLMGALLEFWYVRCYVSEGRRRLT